MSKIQLSKICKSYNEQSEGVINDLNLDIHSGEFMVFVGPSGCGKSTLLRMIAGLESITDGVLTIDNKIMNDVEPAHREVAMVFQSYALYPHMTVEENIGFGLKMRGLKKAETKKQVKQVAQKLQIEDLLSRYPKQLSGGQRQRVAIGRAIIRRPKVFLFDEPLSNLDASLRVQMRLELAQLHSELKTTMVYVTHDQTEAMTLGHRIVVLNQGRIEQLGAPLELYHNPSNKFVAQFLGSPKINILDYAWNEKKQQFLIQDSIDIKNIIPSDSGLFGKLSQATSIGIRPEDLTISENQGFLVAIKFIENLGDSTILYVDLGGSLITVKLPAGVSALNLKSGQEVRLLAKIDNILLFDGDGLRVN